MTLNRNDQFKSLLSLGSTYVGPDDLSCQAAVKWDKDNLYFYADVTDNIHFCKWLHACKLLEYGQYSACAYI